MWHADVGFGLGTPLEPLPFGPGGAHEQSGWSFRVVREGPELVLQSVQEGEWVDLYGFLPEPVPSIDVETSNWWTSTHPRSPFVTGLVAGVYASDGTHTALRGWGELVLSEGAPQRATSRALAREEEPAALAERFGLPGFVLGAGGALVPAAGDGAP